MTTIENTLVIAAPIERCFRLSLCIDLELEAIARYKSSAVAGVTSGLIGSGQTVTWSTRQFGTPVKHTSRITGFDAPVYFQDSMVRGIFRSYVHDHFFRSIDSKTTEMRDYLQFSMPVFMLGAFAERWIVKQRLSALIARRNAFIQRYAEQAEDKFAACNG
jgi:ligand-binding SRPBCC domain-containing protein